MKYQIFLIATLLAVSGESQEISNFRSGLACTDGETFGWICHETENIFITGQGTCVSNGSEIPCTWHGFEFEYSDFTEDTVFECSFSTSMGIDLVNPEERLEENVQVSIYRLSIPAGSGNFFNPQYVNLAVDAEPTHRNDHTTCRLNGVQVAEFNHVFIYPAAP